LKDQETADSVRMHYRSGSFRYLSEYGDDEALNKATFALYKFSNVLGTVNLANSHAVNKKKKNAGGKNFDFLVNHGI